MTRTIEPRSLADSALGLPAEPPAVSPAEDVSREPDASRDPLAVPEGVDRSDINWGVAIMFTVVHGLALLAVLPWLFSWSGLVFMLVGLYAFGGIGINLCYHRLLTHRSFATPKWFEKVLTLIAFCNMEGSSVHWIGAHRMHHKHSDDQPDPHSPLVDFLWSHMGWMMAHNPAIDDRDQLRRFAADLWKDDFHRWFDTRNRFLLVYLAHALAIFGIGCAVGAYLEVGVLQMGLSWLVWGVFVRTVLVWHVTWSINSFTHLFGYRTYKSGDDSRNNWLFGLLAFGEGWHNNHHADQRSATNHHRWWEVDVTYYMIRLLSCVGLASNIITPKRNDGTTHDVSNKKLS